ncbi:MAG: hypothetical protein ACM3UX_01060, partial [Candidatus Woesearchaeota archaeon]
MIKLLLALALAQGDGSRIIRTSPGTIASADEVYELATYPFGGTWATQGSFADDAGTVSHVTFNGSALVDPYGAWSTVGSPTFGVKTPFYPDGFSNPPRTGVGYLTGGKFFQTAGGGASRGDLIDKTVCVAFDVDYLDTIQSVLIGDGGWATAGWYMQVQANQSVQAIEAKSGTAYNTSTGAQTVNVGPNVACMGHAGGTLYVKLNLGATASTGAADAVTDPSLPMMLGVYGPNTSGS